MDTNAECPCQPCGIRSIYEHKAMGLPRERSIVVASVGSCVSAVLRAPWVPNIYSLPRIANARKRATARRRLDRTSSRLHSTLEATCPECRESRYEGFAGCAEVLAANVRTCLHWQTWEAVVQIGIFKDSAMFESGESCSPGAFYRQHHRGVGGHCVSMPRESTPAHSGFDQCLAMLRRYESREGHAHWACPTDKRNQSIGVVTQDDWNVDYSSAGRRPAGDRLRDVWIHRWVDLGHLPALGL